MSDTTYPNLFDACTPRDDVLDGTLQEDEFAASLATVAHARDEAPPVYRDTELFFDMTYPTDGLKTLLSNLTGRFLASGGYDSNEYTSSILCLDTRFGGGKTHDLIASYHLATNPTAANDLGRHLLPGDEEFATAYQDAVADGLDVDTAVFVGGHVDAQNARSDRTDPNAPNTRTMWGEIAYQLYGVEGYELLKEYDQERNAPGQNTLKDLFDLGDGPALVLVDEIAAYLESASAVEVGSATLASQTLSFVLSLLETASESDDVTIVYSIADTAFEEEAEDIRGLIDELNQIGRRQHKTVTPTDESEVGQVLQHRLFEEINGDAAASVAQSYFQFYTNSERQFPQEATDASYVDRLEREYPFHPTVIDTLTEKIDTIPKFQRTRGALKLLARAVYYRWNNQPEHFERHWLRLYDLTPADDAPSGSINSTLHESLFEFVDLSSAVSADIYTEDGTAHAQLEDRKWTEKGIPPLGSHMTTAVLWHSLAYGEQATGFTRAEMNETLGHPGIRFDNYDSALDALGGSDMSVACYYLYDEERVRFKSDPNLIRIIDQRVDNTPDAQARSRFEARLESETGTGAFEPVLYPESPADLPDKASTPQIAVMHMDTAPVTEDLLTDEGNEESIPEKVQSLYQKSASKQGGDVQSRVYKNYVLFLAPDDERVRSAVDEARHLEAIEALLDNSQRTADLSDEQLEDLKERQQEKYGLLGELVRGVYRHLYYVDRDGLTHITINATEANGGTSLVHAVEETLEDRLIKADADAKGVAFFKQKLWQRTQDSMTTQQLVEQFAKKPGLPYLLSTKPLRKTVAKMVDEAGYTYWDSEAELAYWDGESADEPENWSKRSPFAESPDVRTTISDTDVKIGSEYVVYTSIEALLDVHHDPIRPPEATKVECAEDGCTTMVEPSGDGPAYCAEHEETTTATCESCGREFEESELNAAGLCRECAQPSGWESSTSQMAASRAFNEIRTHALSKSPADGTPGISQVTVEVMGEDRLSKGSFIAQRGAFTDREEQVSVRMNYDVKTSTGSTYNASYQGSLTDFSRVTNQPDPFGESVNVTLKFRVDFEEPEAITDAEDDVLAELQAGLGETNIDVKVQARGPTEIPAEVTQ
ncbi:hypothetical protein GCM10009037_26570 [Halarchaeum grantii]|uniref:DUF499 domain-containing protein n=1 Tax=Halarchaeum grantii TaxID=1193105 RepID=A0A830F5N3_9EURY|nr:DUF499 domain-containing protein [Halarchaeum grantii]GGL41666.1 hypothetical protein GCM10009037_26570 [Halarchaeum grantii]